MSKQTLINRLRSWSSEVRQDVENTEELGEQVLGSDYQAFTKGQIQSTREVDKILDEHECSCQEQ